MYAQKLVLKDDTEEEKHKGTCAVNIFQLCIVQKNYKSYLYVYAVTMIDLMTIGSQDICRSPPLVMADNGDTTLEDEYQLVFWSLA